MQKSISTRLAALESRDPSPLTIGPLTADDYNSLLMQIAMQNVRMENGRAVRTWRIGFLPEHTADLDRAVARCNAYLATLPNPPKTTEQLDDSLQAKLAWCVSDDDLSGAVQDMLDCGAMVASIWPGAVQPSGTYLQHYCAALAGRFNTRASAEEDGRL